MEFIDYIDIILILSIMDLIVKSTKKLSKITIQEHNIQNPYFLSISKIIHLNQEIHIAGKYIITSQNAVHKYVINHLPKGSEFLVVGESSENILKSAGFTKIVTYRNIKSLILGIDTSSEYTYLRGNIIKADIFSVFSNINECITYNVEYYNEIDQDVIEVLINNQIARVFIFSDYTCINFIECIKKYNLQNFLNAEFFIPSMNCERELRNIGVYDIKLLTL